MNKDKAIVLEKAGGFYLVLDSEGTFRRVRSHFKAEVGEEIEVAANQSNRLSNRSLRVLLSVAALFLLIFLSTLSWSFWQTPVAVAMLSVDINPSLEISLDKGAHIVNAKAKNDDALQLLQGVNLKGQTLTVAMNRLVTRAVELHFLSEERKWIVLGLSQGFEGKVSSQSDLVEVDSQALQSGLNEVAASKGLGLQVVMFKLTPPEGLEAQKTGLSLGEYALWQTAEKAGLSVQQQTVKNSTERSHLLEVPAVQSELRHNRNTIDIETTAERSNQKITKDQDQDHEKEKVKDKLSTKEESEKQNMSEVKRNPDSAHEEKPGNATVKGKNDNPSQMKSRSEARVRHGNNPFTITKDND
ncbi:MAG: anti-sigma factor domain-containing protein [Desulfitobacteriaceae bacterium]